MFSATATPNLAAGSPLLAEENVEERIAVPEPLGRSADFLLTVRGDSMIEAGTVRLHVPQRLEVSESRAFTSKSSVDQDRNFASHPIQDFGKALDSPVPRFTGAAAVV